MKKVITTIVFLLAVILNAGAVEKLQPFENINASSDGQELVDALIKYSIAESNKPDADIDSIVNRVDSYAENETRPDIKALLYYLSAKILFGYTMKYSSAENFNLYDFYNESQESDDRPSSIKECNFTQLNNLLEEYVKMSLLDENELLSRPLSNYSKIIDLGSNICPSLYHFLALEGYNLVTHDDDILKALLDNCEPGSAFHMQVILRTANRFSAKIYAELLDRPYVVEEMGVIQGYYDKFEDNENCGALLESMPMGSAMFYQYEEYLSRFPNSSYANAITNHLNRIKVKRVLLYSNNEFYSNDSLIVTVGGCYTDDVILRLYCLNDYFDVNRLGKYNLDSFTFVEEKKVKLGGLAFNDDQQVAFSPKAFGRYVILPSFLGNDGRWVSPGDEFMCYTLIEVNDEKRPDGEMLFNKGDYAFELSAPKPELLEEYHITLPSLNTNGGLWFSNRNTNTHI